MRNGQFSPRTYRAAALLLLCVSPALGQGKLKVLYNFRGGIVSAPHAGVILDHNGSLYGTAGGGVYKLTRQADGQWTESVLHSWYHTGIWAGLVADTQGSLYSATISGGTDNNGTIFELHRAAGWKEQTLYSFGSNDACCPRYTLLRDHAGDLYEADGLAYEISQGTDGRWHEKVLYRFQVGTSDGWNPVGTLVSDAKGNLYGATEFGGIHPCPSGGDGCGTVYELMREPDGKWQERILHRFDQFKNDGELPLVGLVMDSQGNLYGTTTQGGSVHDHGQCFVGCGTVFELSPQPKGEWKETTLYNFCQDKGCLDGAGGLQILLDGAGNLYGISGGGLGPCNGGCGMVFKLSRGTNGKWTHRVLHRFSGPDGGVPEGLTMGPGGHLYGTTFWGGKYLYGVVYEITP
ncbi:MAG: choice-of-anchor tandem repeat GloVer-containing protein [Acidobacteriaceae bacterium]